MDFLQLTLLILAGFAAGFINTLAGSGSLITLPLLIFLGLPANVANGTNRVSVLLQNIVGVRAFRKTNILDLRGVLHLGIPAFLGSIIGARIAVNLNDELMETVIGIVMVGMLFVILLRPQKWLVGTLIKIDTPGIRNYLIFFFIGIYGGFIQAGVGIFLIAGLVLGIGYDIVRANAVKVGIVLTFTIGALIVFIINNQVNWEAGLLLSIGSMAGAWAGAKVAIEKGAVWVRRLLIIVVIISAANLLGLIDFISKAF